jgi:hypothetical protein
MNFKLNCTYRQTAFSPLYDPVRSKFGPSTFCTIHHIALKKCLGIDYFILKHMLELEGLTSPVKDETVGLTSNNYISSQNGGGGTCVAQQTAGFLLFNYLLIHMVPTAYCCLGGCPYIIEKK